MAGPRGFIDEQKYKISVLEILVDLWSLYYDVTAVPLELEDLLWPPQFPVINKPLFWNLDGPGKHCVEPSVLFLIFNQWVWADAELCSRKTALKSDLSSSALKFLCRCLRCAGWHFSTRTYCVVTRWHGHPPQIDPFFGVRKLSIYSSPALQCTIHCW